MDDIHSFGAQVATANVVLLLTQLNPAATLESFLKSMQFILIPEDGYCMRVYRFQRSAYCRAYVNVFSLRITRLKVPLC